MAVTFCSSDTLASSVIYYNTYAQENEIYLFYTRKCSEKLCFVVVSSRFV